MVLDTVQLVLSLLEDEELPVIRGADWLSELLRYLLIVDSVLQNPVGVIHIVLVFREVHANDRVLSIFFKFILVKCHVFYNIINLHVMLLCRFLGF